MTLDSLVILGTSWEDQVLFLASIFFTILLIPAIIHRHKPPMITALGTAFWLYWIAVAEYSLGLYWTVPITILNATLWVVIGVQKWYTGNAG